MKKYLTVSIAAYNVEKYLAKCLDSFVESTVIDKLDIIVVDDGSNDKTAKIAEEYSKRYSDSIRLVSKTNGGHGSTINTSIKLATGKYFKTVDADDWVETEKIQKLVNSIEFECADLIINPYYEVEASSMDKNLRQIVLEGYDSNTIYRLEDIATNMIPAMHSYTIRTSIVKQMGAVIDENCFYVDMEYILFPLPLVKTVRVLNYPVYDYLMGTSTQSMNLENFIKRRDQHLIVIDRLINFFHELTIENIELMPNTHSLIRKRISSAIYAQYRILLLLPPQKTRNEFISYDRLILSKWKIYSADFPGNTKKLVELFRMFKYKNYTVIVTFLQKLGLINKNQKIL